MLLKTKRKLFFFASAGLAITNVDYIIFVSKKNGFIFNNLEHMVLHAKLKYRWRHWSESLTSQIRKRGLGKVLHLSHQNICRYTNLIDNKNQGSKVRHDYKEIFGMRKNP